MDRGHMSVVSVDIAKGFRTITNQQKAGNARRTAMNLVCVLIATTAYPTCTK